MKNKQKGSILVNIIIILLIVVLAYVFFNNLKKKNENNKTSLLAIYQTNDIQKPNEVEVSIINPLADILISKKNVVLDYPLINNQNYKSIVYDKESKTIYVRTLGNLVFNPNSINDYDGEPVCPTQGECFDFTIESFSPSGLDKPVLVYKNLSDGNSFTVFDSKKYKNEPYFSLMSLNEKYIKLPAQINSFKSTQIEGISIKYGPSNVISIKKDFITKDIKLSSNIESVYYFISPDKRSIYIVTKKYDAQKGPDLISNPYKIGLEKIDVKDMTVDKVTENFFPETFSSDGAYLFGFWKINTGTIPVVFNIKTNERKELQSIEPIPSHIADKSGAPIPYVFTEWLD